MHGIFALSVDFLQKELNVLWTPNVLDTFLTRCGSEKQHSQLDFETCSQSHPFTHGNMVCC